MSSTGGQMTIAQYLIFVGPFFVTVLVVFGMKYFSAIFQARARLATVEKILQQVE